MSIIHDALKKIQEKTPSPNPGPAAVPGHEQPWDSVWEKPAATTATTASPHPIFIVFGVALSIAVLVIFTVLFRLAKEAMSHPKSVIDNSATQIVFPKPSSISEAITSAIAGPSASSALLNRAVTPVSDPSKLSLAPGSLRLEGIMDMGSKRVALINGEIYEEGQLVEGKMIAEISRTKVTIIDNGMKETLPLKK